MAVNRGVERMVMGQIHTLYAVHRHLLILWNGEDNSICLRWDHISYDGDPEKYFVCEMCCA
jgi:hypothetical protein